MADAVPLVIITRRRKPCKRKFLPRITINVIRDIDFVKKFRLSRELTEELLQIVGGDLVKSLRGGNTIPPDTQVLASLRYLGSGGFYSEVGETAGISRSSLCRILQNFVASVNNHLDNIKFPQERNEVLREKQLFYQLCRLPNVVGAIDGTLVPIIAPIIEPEVYVCRKGYHAINCQAIVSKEMRFLDVVANWPGSTHDSNVFEHSRIKDYLETTNNQIILGDSGYPLRPYLLTLVREPANEQEETFNVKHKRGRDVVERTFGVLKSRFRCLHRSGGVLPFAPGKCASIFFTCCRLHNMCIQNNEEFNDQIIGEEHEEVININNNDVRGIAVQQAYIRMQ